ncbi:MAG: FumA C-terminus/TtdB family hydratase beta subunit [Canidatus Methanoxibalbensis ujae]|nr:FumA C-terminus/TtdB family hydratase beta subunit [Candidatus Methanoxibalbensis ujae]RLG38877.1 MAG: fumarate hydratase [Methanosarcinales archaeon]
MIVLKAPLSESDVRSLRLGDIVFLNGDIFTARDRAHARIIASDFDDIPIERGSVIFHCGPLVRRVGSSWLIISAGPTTSERMNATAPVVIEKLRIRAIIGKGGMGASVRDAMRRCGCVYLAMTGGAGVLAAIRASVKNVYWTDLGLAEAVWHLHVEDFGPLVVSIDANGASLYDEVLKKARASFSQKRGSSCP